MGACRLRAPFLRIGADNTADSQCSNQVVTSVPRGNILDHVCLKPQIYLALAATINFFLMVSLGHTMGYMLEFSLVSFKKRLALDFFGRLRKIN